MNSFYTQTSKGKSLTCFFLSVSLLFLSGRLAAQTRDSTVTAIYTDYSTFWKTSTSSNSAILPDTSHDLLAFTFRGKTYSTGVNNTILNTKLGSASYVKGAFKALPIKNISG